MSPVNTLLSVITSYSKDLLNPKVTAEYVHMTALAPLCVPPLHSHLARGCAFEVAVIGDLVFCERPTSQLTSCLSLPSTAKVSYSINL